MQCNIDARGQRVRLLIGIANLAAAVLLAALVLIGVLASPLWWIGVAALAAGGAFTCFEARSGWCAVRAMGIRTPF